MPDAGAVDRACWNLTSPGPMRSDLLESFTDWNPERPCGNESCVRHGVVRRPLSATRLQMGRMATTGLMALAIRRRGFA